jgi:hypothetical protein
MHNLTMDPLGDIPRLKYTCLLDVGGGASRHKQKGERILK